MEQSLRHTQDSLKAEQASLWSTDLTIWIALRRMNEGGVTLLEGSYYHHGRPVPEYLNTPFTELVEAGYLTATKTGPGAADMHPVSFTQQGRDRYAMLCGKRGVCADPPVYLCPDTAEHRMSRSHVPATVSTP